MQYNLDVPPDQVNQGDDRRYLINRRLPVANWIPPERLAWPSVPPPLEPGQSRNLIQDSSGILSLGGFTRRQLPAGGREEIFSIRTPPQGVRLSKDSPVKLTGDFVRKALEMLRIKDKQQSYNVGIAATMPGGMLPGFMDRVLRPKSVNVTFGKSSREIQDEMGRPLFDQSSRRRGIGLTAEVLRAMFRDNAPTAGVQYDEQNGSDKAKAYAASLNIPMGRGVFSLFGRKSPGKTLFGARGRFPL